MEDRGLEEGLPSVAVLETLCCVLDLDIMGLSRSESQSLLWKRGENEKIFKYSNTCLKGNSKIIYFSVKSHKRNATIFKSIQTYLGLIP